jgi:hypothetical protein
MRVKFNHWLLACHLDEALTQRVDPNAILQGDSQSKHMDDFVAAAYKITIPTTNGYRDFYLYIRNKRHIRDDGKVEFTEWSSFVLCDKNNFTNQSKIHINNIPEIQEYLKAGDKQSINKALRFVANKIADAIKKNI